MMKKIILIACMLTPVLIWANKDLPKGPNHRQAAPVLTSAATNGSKTTVKGSLKSIPLTKFIIQFFSNPANRNPITEGTLFLGQTTVKTDAKGRVRFKTCLPCTSAGSFVSATATRIAEKHELTDTSMFSQNVEVV